MMEQERYFHRVRVALWHTLRFPTIALSHYLPVPPPLSSRVFKQALAFTLSSFHKAGKDKLFVASYRPISLLPVVSKGCGRIIYNRKRVLVCPFHDRLC